MGKSGTRDSVCRGRHGRTWLPAALGLALLAGMALWVAPAAAAATLASALQHRLADPPWLRARGLSIADPVAAHYHHRGFHPVWVSPQGPAAAAHLAVAFLEQAAEHGLNPEAYRAPALRALLDGPTEGEDLLHLELLLSDALVRYARHLRSGRVDPSALDREWCITPPSHGDAETLEAARDAGALAAFLAALPPPSAGYRDLLQALQRYRDLERRGGWPRAQATPKLERGAEDPAVAWIRRRLAASGDLAIEAPASGDARFFDPVLDAAVRRFQARHGLLVDGIVGPRTWAALNRPVAERIRQIALNLERWRWLPRDLGPRHVAVNMAGFRLELVEQGRTALAMDVIVGTPYRRTPVFTARMTYLVLNPDWNVPHRIAVRDKLPLIRQDPDYLRRQGMRVLTGWGPQGHELDPGALDWDRYSAAYFPYRLRQDPGPQNALGRIKFMLPNPHDVYLHDTPARELFRHPVRAFSSGCIRLERPLDLAEQLLGDAPGWDRAALEAAIASGVTRNVVLPEPIPVYLLYQTAWVDEAGGVQFRDDVYGRDAKLERALRDLGPAGVCPPA